MNEVLDCPTCGMPRDEWPDAERGGFEKDGSAHCCKGCAERSGCTCARADDRAPTREELRDDPASGAFLNAHRRETKQVKPEHYGTDVTSGAPPRTASHD